MQGNGHQYEIIYLDAIDFKVPTCNHMNCQSAIWESSIYQRNYIELKLSDFLLG